MTLEYVNKLQQSPRTDVSLADALQLCLMWEMLGPLEDAVGLRLGLTHVSKNTQRVPLQPIYTTKAERMEATRRRSSRPSSFHWLLIVTQTQRGCLISVTGGFLSERRRVTGFTVFVRGAFVGDVDQKQRLRWWCFDVVYKRPDSNPERGKHLRLCCCSV